MALIPHSGSLTIPSLTLEHLSSVPKRDNDDFLLAYHREQRRFLELYASYGRTEIKSWNAPRADSTHTSDLPAATPSKGVDNFVFGTPVLKARVSKLPFNLPATHIERLNGSQLEHAESSKALEAQRPLRSKTSRTLTPKPTPALHAVATHDKILPGFKPSKSPKPRKHSPRGDGNTDEEHENRLAERRQRKKMKRDVIKRDINGGSEEEQMLKKPEKKPTKAQAGFALMHGFSATNVGKNRLTLDPLLPRQNTGVFKKGKASYATKVVGLDSKKQQHSEVYFSESKFLNEKKGGTRHLPRSESPSACSSPTKIVSKKRTRKDRLEPSDIDEQSEKSKSPSSGGKKSCTPYNPNDSIVWDIEKDSGFDDPDGSSHMRQGTILVNFPKSAHHPHVEVDSTGTDTGTTSVPGKTVAIILQDNSTDHPLSAISLGPSQSASQVGAKELTSYHSSNYFRVAARPSKHMPATSFHPISDPSTKEHLDKHSDAIGAFLSHTDDGLDTPSAHIAKQSSVISVHAYDAMTIDGFHHSVLVLDNSVSVLQNYGFAQERSYWSEVNWDGYDGGCLPSTFDISNFPSISSSVCSGSEFGMAGLQFTGGSEGPLTGYPMASGHSCGISSHLGTYDDRPPCFSPTYLEDPYLENTATDAQSAQDPPPPNSFSPFCEAINTAESEACIDFDVIFEEGKEELESYLECSVHATFEEDGDNVEVDNFYQGRALLYGLNPILGCSSVSNGLLCVEAEVAGLLKQNHWLPQKL